MTDIGVTDHALDHWRGRCRREAPDSVRAAKAYIAAIVADGRIATRLEARCLSLYVNRARRWDAPTASMLSPDQVVVSDGVAFVLAFDCSPPVVTTCALLAMVLRQCRGLPGSKLRTLEASGRA